MSENLYTLYTTQFSTVLEMKLQQAGSKLRGLVTTGTHTGAKQASPMQQMGAIQSAAPAGRFAPKNRTDANFTRRWVFPIDREIDQLIDSFDELKTIVDPKSQYSTNAANAAGRDWDDEIIKQATGTNYTGTDVNGLSAETWASFSSAYSVAVDFKGASTSGLTIPKIIETKRIFRKNHVDLDVDPVTIVAGSTQESDLLGQTQIVSTEFNDHPVLVDGRVTRILGVNIVYSERLPIIATNNRGVLAFAKSGMYLGTWAELQNRVSVRNDLSGEPYDLYTKYSYGATRTQPGKVVQIACYDTAGADITP